MPNTYDYDPPDGPPESPEEAAERLRDFTASYARATYGRLRRHTRWSELANRLVEEFDAATTVNPIATPSDIIKSVAGFFQTSIDSLASRSRRRDVLVPRQIAMYLCRRYTDATLAQIGQLLDRDHPAVVNAVSSIELQLLENASLRCQVEALIGRLDELGYRPKEDG